MDGFTTVHKAKGSAHAGKGAKGKGKGKDKDKTSKTPAPAPVEKMDAEAAEDREDLAVPDADADEEELLVLPRAPLGGASSGPATSTLVSASEPQADGMDVDTDGPVFKPVSRAAQADAESVSRGQLRRVPIPPHRMTPLKKDWSKIFVPLVEQAGLQVRMNLKRKAVEIKSSSHTPEVGLLQKAADFVKAYAMGFEADDAVALLRMDDLFIDSFEVKDVKTLTGDHLSRAIGRIAGKDGRTRFAIENASRTRVVVADSKIHILGSFQNIRIARDAIVSLIMGSPPGKVYNNLKVVSSRMRQRA